MPAKNSWGLLEGEEDEVGEVGNVYLHAEQWKPEKEMVADKRCGGKR